MVTTSQSKVWMFISMASFSLLAQHGGEPRAVSRPTLSGQTVDTGKAIVFKKAIKSLYEDAAKGVSPSIGTSASKLRSDWPYDVDKLLTSIIEANRTSIWRPSDTFLADNEGFLSGMIGTDFDLWVDFTLRELSKIERAEDFKKPEWERTETSSQMRALLPIIAATAFHAREQIKEGNMAPNHPKVVALQTKLNELLRGAELNMELRDRSPYHARTLIRYVGWLGSETSLNNSLATLRTYGEDPGSFEPTEAEGQAKQFNALQAKRILLDHIASYDPSDAFHVDAAKVLAEAALHPKAYGRIARGVPDEILLIGITPAAPGSLITDKLLKRQRENVKQLPKLVLGGSVLDLISPPDDRFSGAPKRLKRALFIEAIAIRSEGEQWYPSWWNLTGKENEFDKFAASLVVPALTSYAIQYISARQRSPEATAEELRRSAMVAVRKQLSSKFLLSYVQGEQFNPTDTRLSSNGKEIIRVIHTLLGLDLDARKVRNDSESITAGLEALDVLVENILKKSAND